jgi:hypothetical protein
MGSYENVVKIEEMRRRMEEGDAQSALRILDSLELKKIKNMVDLNLMAEVYDENERYEEATQLYLKIYEKTKSRKSLFQLTEISIKRNNVEDAQHYLLQYQKVAPKDFYRYVFRYKIDKLKGEAYEQLLESLITLKNAEYIEKWAYELAKTYYKAGMEKECIQECSDIILWFGEGSYVEKAKMLRSYYSGESGKDKIMEELKRRASIKDNNKSLAQSEDIDADSLVEQEEIHNLNVDSNEEPSNEEFSNKETSNEEPLNEEPLNEETSSEESSNEEPSNKESSNEQTFFDKEELHYSSMDFMVEETSEFEVELKNDIQNILTDGWEEEPEYEEATLSASELAEKEVEDTIYHMLEEEDMDEEDQKLSRIAEELQIDLDEIFGNFLHVSTIKKQLVKSLEGILDEHTKTVFMIITGTVGSGKTALAKDITLFLNKSGKLKSSKIAKIKADKLNSIDVMTKRETLKDCCVVVENASELKRKTIDSLLELSQILQGDIAIIFEENKKNMNKLFRECPKLMDLFKNRIHLPQYIQEDLIGFAYASLKQQEYCLDLKAESILKHKINEIIKQSEPHRYLEQIYDLIHSVMNAADIRTGKQLSELAIQGRLKEVETMSVLPEDFSFKL